MIRPALSHVRHRLNDAAALAAADAVRHRRDHAMAGAFQRAAHVDAAEILVFLARPHGARKARRQHEFARIAQIPHSLTYAGVTPARANGTPLAVASCAATERLDEPSSI